MSDRSLAAIARQAVRDGVTAFVQTAKERPVYIAASVATFGLPQTARFTVNSFREACAYESIIPSFDGGPSYYDGEDEVLQFLPALYGAGFFASQLLILGISTYDAAQFYLQHLP